MVEERNEDKAPARGERRRRVQSAVTGMAVLKGLARMGGRASLTALAAHIEESRPRCTATW
jgi:hypothetical protein